MTRNHYNSFILWRKITHTIAVWLRSIKQLDKIMCTFGEIQNTILHNKIDRIAGNFDNYLLVLTLVWTDMVRSERRLRKRMPNRRSPSLFSNWHYIKKNRCWFTLFSLGALHFTAVRFTIKTLGNVHFNNNSLKMLLWPLVSVAMGWLKNKTQLLSTKVFLGT